MNLQRIQEIKTKELAQRIIDLDFWEAYDNGETPESVADVIRNDPLTVIEYLVELAEESQSL